VIGKILELKRSGYPVYYSENVLTSTINWPISLEEKRYATKDDDFVKGHRMIPCYHGRLKFQIDADGRVVTCWAHDDADAPNVKELGVGKAIEECRRRDICRYCTFLANNEHNALMHMSPRNIWNILRIQVRDALKIGYRR
jgi:MoaA/NifB/PqqE/SkfB family radical SAM enzyme